MPIRQDRLMRLIAICEDKHEREKTLRNQYSAAHYNVRAALTNDDLTCDQKLEVVVEAFQVIGQYINRSNDDRENELIVFTQERKHFDLNYRHNQKNRDAMANKRRTVRYENEQ